VDLDPGVVPFPLERWPLEALDITHTTLDVSTCSGCHLGGNPEVIGTCGHGFGLWRPNVSLPEPNVP
jgi:hypothetical protein